ncbi:WD repeat-containing protein 82-B-like isoform X1 [Hibiscus syriacus]|uniref:WD repeat-containing protein 82-B-like isoform X1 n=1 Tax=Hibiscus syriacus TaxID=106335 RepID=A0A6A3AU24_HIBSY|nr:WD repeat-containing protein 82-B-like isoform X1 [Hibiscus syriacus]
MTEISTSRSLRFLLFFASVSLHFISGFCDDSTDSKNSSKTKSDMVNNTGAKVVLILLGLVAVGLFSFFLFKLWQKKKRDEQYARLLQLFEEDDELELELGLRD